MAIIDMNQVQLRAAWEECVQKGMQAKEEVQQELAKASDQHVGFFALHTPLELTLISRLSMLNAHMIMSPSL